MKIVIIEDEALTAEDLANTIKLVDPTIEIVATLYSVRKAIGYFRENDKPDLIFCDIQLGDGLSFEIFNQLSLNTPVIFCTAFNEYALKAFKANGIDYIVKPFTSDSVATALERYRQLKKNFSASTITLDTIAQLLNGGNVHQEKSVLVYFKEKILPINFSDTAFFSVENETVYLNTFDQQKYSVNKTMEELEHSAGKDFYRANRKYLLNRRAIKDASVFFNRKLLVTLTVRTTTRDPITISKTKTPEFLRWLSGN